MLKNKIPLSSIAGFNLFALGGFFLFIGFWISSDIRGDFSGEDILGLSSVMGTGCALLLGGMGMMLKLKWARFLINIVVYIAFALLAFALYIFVSNMMNNPYWRNRFEQMSVLFFGITTLAGIFLFINNHRLIDELQNKKIKSE